jgi:hypothetical protein
MRSIGKKQITIDPFNHIFNKTDRAWLNNSQHDANLDTQFGKKAYRRLIEELQAKISTNENLLKYKQ